MRNQNYEKLISELGDKLKRGILYIISYLKTGESKVLVKELEINNRPILDRIFVRIQGVVTGA